MLLVLLLDAVLLVPQTGVSWRALDVDKNARFDRDDVAAILADGLDLPTLDVNGDGKKDARDAWELTVLLTKWDRNADLVISEPDFTPLPRLEARVDAAAVLTLARKIVDASAAPMPGFNERRIPSPLTEGKKPRTEAQYYEAGGAVALLSHDLESATWAYARSVLAAPSRASALSGLGFCLMNQGRTDDALLVLSLGLSIEPKACPLNANLGWLYARQGMLAEAEQAYQLAGEVCPRVAQYALNEAVVRVARNDRIGALRVAQRAARENPIDPEPVRLVVALDPPAAATIEELAELYEREQHGRAPTLPRWSELDERAKISAIFDSLDFQASRECDDVKRDVGRALVRQMVAVEKAVRPEWKKWEEDWARWANNHRQVIEHDLALGREAEAEVGARCADLARHAAMRKLGAGPVVLTLARSIAARERVETERRMRLPSGIVVPPNYAQQMRAGAAKGEQKTISELYGHRMALARAQLAMPATPQQPLFEPKVKALGAQGVAMLGPTIYSACITLAVKNPSYSNGEVCKSIRGVPELNFPLTGSITLSAFGIIELEIDLRDLEIKLQAGEGLVFAGTWSPKAGFGFQVGVGFDVDVGPVNVELMTYLKFGSDGAVVWDTEFSSGVGDPVSGEISWTDTTVLFPAGHEPVGAL